MVSVSFTGLANVIFFIYIVYDDSIFSLKICHMKHSMHLAKHSVHLGKTAVTILLALSFLGLVMFLSYIFITTTVGR
jgi:hypothetical protein